MVGIDIRDQYNLISILFSLCQHGNECRCVSHIPIVSANEGHADRDESSGRSDGIRHLEGYDADVGILEGRLYRQVLTASRQTSLSAKIP